MRKFTRPYLVAGSRVFRICACTLLALYSVWSFSQVRGPYLQSGTSTSMVVRWRTDAPTSSQVRYGSSPTQLTNMVSNATEVVEHEIKLTGLSPLTKYYYSIGSTTTVLQGDTDNYFSTLPRVGASGLVRIGVLGDCGNNSTNQLQVRDQLKNYLGSNYMNAWILLGDNAYWNGSEAEYQSNFFNYYKDKLLKQSPLYPCPGNHDYANDGNLQNTHNTPYYSIFSMPTNGEAGGVPSNNKAYFSFDVGNVHFLSLDSYGREDNTTHLYDTLGKQVQWIKQDLAANRNKGWVVAYWHHPPYTKGNHDSDTEGDLVAIRNNFIRILERMGVDLILCGHSHDYERSWLISGHYGPAATFNPAISNLNSSSGLYNGTSNSCPYVKDSVIHRQGTVYVVSGSAGQLGGQQPGFPHNAMYYSNASVGGSMLLEVHSNRLDAKWICSDGVIRDQFTMMKEVNRKKDTTISSGSPITLTATYEGTYNWLLGNQTTRSITVTPSPGVTHYIVKDNYSCIADTFNVNAVSILPLTWGTFKGWYKGNSTNQLQWQTFNERNNNEFEIERSSDGIFFTRLAKIPANNIGSSQYNYADLTISTSAPIYFYRIKQVNINGSYSYSPLLAIRKAIGTDKFDIQIVPNPAPQGEAKIFLTGISQAEVAITVTDALGRIITNRKLMLTSSPQSFIPGTKAGTYFIGINIEGYTIRKKIVIK